MTILASCVECGRPCRKNPRGSRCPEHAAALKARLQGRTAGWRERQRQVQAHLEAHGLWCPGLGRPAHEVFAANQLTVHHLTAWVRGKGAGPTAVVCRSCNASARDRFRDVYADEGDDEPWAFA